MKGISIAALVLVSVPSFAGHKERDWKTARVFGFHLQAGTAGYHCDKRSKDLRPKALRDRCQQLRAEVSRRPPLSPKRFPGRKS